MLIYSHLYFPKFVYYIQYYLKLKYFSVLNKFNYIISYTFRYFPTNLHIFCSQDFSSLTIFLIKIYYIYFVTSLEIFIFFVHKNFLP